MLTRRWFLIAGRRLFGPMFVLALLVGALPVAGGAPAAPATLDQFFYLPLIVGPGQVYGTVTENGVAVGGVPVTLYFYNGGAWSSIANTTTAADGRYRFVGAPSLLPGQRYGVEYLNTNDGNNYDGRLYFWVTPELTTYDATVGAHIGDFDVADTDLVSPFDATGVPATFTWVKRANSPTDSYAFELFDLDYSSPYFAAGSLGWVDTYQMNGVPGGFGTYYWYGWDVITDAPDGGFGVSFWYGEIYFTNTLASGADAGVTTLQVPSAQRPDAGGVRPLSELAAVAAGE